jgi:hypothetical protein
MQRTIVLEYNGQKIVSQPFTFRHACIMDDTRFKGEGLSSGARNALISMFEGSILTEEIIDNQIKIKELRKATDQIIDMFLGIDEEVKNS